MAAIGQELRPGMGEFSVGFIEGSGWLRRTASSQYPTERTLGQGRRLGSWRCEDDYTVVVPSRAFPVARGNIANCLGRSAGQGDPLELPFREESEIPGIRRPECKRDAFGLLQTPKGRRRERPQPERSLSTGVFGHK